MKSNIETLHLWVLIMEVTLGLYGITISLLRSSLTHTSPFIENSDWPSISFMIILLIFMCISSISFGIGVIGTCPARM